MNYDSDDENGGKWKAVGGKKEKKEEEGEIPKEPPRKPTYYTTRKLREEDHKRRAESLKKDNLYTIKFADFAEGDKEKERRPRTAFVSLPVEGNPINAKISLIISKAPI
jgi:hypothetical protein